MTENRWIPDQGKWIEDRLKQLGEAGRTEAGIWRSIHTQEDLRGKALIRQWMEEAGLAVREDAFGNILGRLEGQVSETILAGSHVDTVRDGGLYDGAAGVVCAIAAVGELIRKGWKPYYSVEVVGIEEEEGSRFDLSYPGSNALIGGLSQEELEIRDENGISLKEAMIQKGFPPEKISSADRRGQVLEYIELHVEQGAVLDRQNVSIGIVENIVGMVNFAVTIHGEQNHAGSTPMYMRKDPMVAAAEMIIAMTERVKAISHTGVITVGEISIHPGVANAIAGRVSFSVDLRDGRSEPLHLEEEAVLECAEAMRRQGFAVDCQMYNHEEPVPLCGPMIDALEAVTEEANVSHMRMNSGAGHDAMIIGRQIPACMIFVPSVGGISHSPKEYTAPEHLGIGCEVLARLLAKRAGGCEK